jgi:hypothetical protein
MYKTGFSHIQKWKVYTQQVDNLCLHTCALCGVLGSIAPARHYPKVYPKIVAKYKLPKWLIQSPEYEKGVQSRGIKPLCVTCNDWWLQHQLLICHVEEAEKALLDLQKEML